MHDRVLVELRALARLDPAGGGAHVRHAHPLLAGVDAAGVLVDQLRLGARRLDAGRSLDQARACRRSLAASFRPGSETRMSATDEFLRNNQAYAERSTTATCPSPRRRSRGRHLHGLAHGRLRACSASSNGEAHIIRNAGGVVTDDEIRSLAISQRLLGDREIIVIQHTECGMLTFSDDELRGELRKDTGMKPPWSPESFTDLDDEVRNSIGRIRQARSSRTRTRARLRLRRGHRQVARGERLAGAGRQLALRRGRAERPARSPDRGRPRRPPTAARST